MTAARSNARTLLASGRFVWPLLVLVAKLTVFSVVCAYAVKYGETLLLPTPVLGDAPVAAAALVAAPPLAVAYNFGKDAGWFGDE